MKEFHKNIANMGWNGFCEINTVLHLVLVLRLWNIYIIKQKFESNYLYFVLKILDGYFFKSLAHQVRTQAWNDSVSTIDWKNVWQSLNQECTAKCLSWWGWENFMNSSQSLGCNQSWLVWIRAFVGQAFLS